MSRTKQTFCVDCKWRVDSHIGPTPEATERMMAHNIAMIGCLGGMWRFPRCGAQPKWESSRQREYAYAHDPVSGELHGVPDEVLPPCQEVNDGACVFFQPKKQWWLFWR